jgi:enoyl-CoA hydratase
MEERPSVRTESNGPVTTIIIDRPDRRNAVDPPTAVALRAAFRAFERDRERRVAVLWGAGGTFCAGYDLKAFAAAPRRLARAYGEGPMGPTRMALTKPVIAAVSGYAVAGGFELALWCDLRVVEESAVMGVFNRRWGVPLIDGGTVRLPALVGLGRALDLILTGRPVNAQEADRIGLANRVVPNGRAREEATALAATIASFPPHCVKSDRRSAYDALGTRLSTALRREHALGMLSAATGESAAGAQRFASGAGRHGKF